MPPAALLWALVAGGPPLALQWGGLTTGVNVLIWARASMLMRSSPLFGTLYPLGCIVGYFIFMKSWLQGPRIQWKARRYHIPGEVRKGSSAGAEDTDA
jgi:hypothetical protein